jgi:ribosome biogenesis GTPase / thiamine phosphate phosphatase
MSKRKLSQQQQWRIEKIHGERSARAARRGERADALLTEGDLGDEQHGIVIAHYGTQVLVESADGSAQRCHVRANLEALVTGDTVVWRAGNPTGVIVAVAPRRSLLERPDAYGKMKPIAANIDYLLIVIAAEPAPFGNLIDRYLVAAAHAQLAPVLVLNKSDLLKNGAHADVVQLIERYRALGCHVISASCTATNAADTGAGLDALKALLKDNVSVFVGQSGVGKSSLINALAPEANSKVGELSEAIAKGRHTTTTAQLYHFPSGGDLIDSPGIREFSLWHVDADAVAAGFIEFQPFLGQCRFRDCSHREEPGCALLGAVARGDIGTERWQSYWQIIESLAGH